MHIDDTDECETDFVHVLKSAVFFLFAFILTIDSIKESDSHQCVFTCLCSPVGTMRHLIVEACITRGLLANTAYFWLRPGGSLANIPASPSQPSPWLAFMDGAPLSASLRAALMASPAGRYVR